MDEATQLPSTAPSAGSLTGSLREKSRSTIEAAIHSPPDDGETLKRVNACLACFYEPEHDEATKAAVRQEYVRALQGLPCWAMHRAFDRWMQSGTRRPSPPELVVLAQRELKPMTDELRRRDDDAQHRHDADRPDRVTPERAAEIMAEHGFTTGRLADAVMPKRIPGTFLPAPAEAIMKARNESKLVAEARAAQAAHEEAAAKAEEEDWG